MQFFINLDEKHKLTLRYCKGAIIGFSPDCSIPTVSTIAKPRQVRVVSVTTSRGGLDDLGCSVFSFQVIKSFTLDSTGTTRGSVMWR